MARDQEPITDAEIEELRAKIRDQRQEIRDDLESDGVDVSDWDVPSDGESQSDSESESDAPADD
jgi:hypothetical protein